MGDTELHEDNLREIDDMVSVCAGLVTVNKESNIVRLVHYTTQEYFERIQKKWFPDAEYNITKSCITYLSFTVFETGYCQRDDEFEGRLRSNQLYDYAACHWGHHARSTVETVLTPAKELILGFSQNESKVSASSQAMMASRDYGDTQRVPEGITGIHLAAYFGLECILVWLLESGAAVEAKDRDGPTPLLLAAERGHEAIVRLLVEEGADIEAKDNEFGQTPLWLATERGHEVIVRLLLKRGAKDGHEDEVKLLQQYSSKLRDRTLASLRTMKSTQSSY